MNTISIAMFRQRADAEGYQKRLSEAGLAAELHDCSGVHWARLDVPAEQFERGYQLMVDWDAAEGGLRGVIRCPECQSLRIEYPQYTHKSTLPNLLVGLLANIGAVPKEFYCLDCHFTWPKEGTRPSRARPHMAPYYFIEGVPQSQPSETRHAA
ncbi:MAG TPA: hypothetical protein VG938_04480 [Verrucomicrobiae bacterium]|jgi:hypothetical protein|nr:hypothetical protein [Verrucomicrobiae bacterium]